MLTLDIVIDGDKIAAAFEKKGNEVYDETAKLHRDLMDTAHRWTQYEAPRRSTGKLKASVKKLRTGDRGLIFISKEIAPYADWVITGRGAFCAKNKKVLRFKVNGKIIFTRCVGPSKPNPFIDRSFQSMQGDINRRVNQFEKWLEEV